MISLNSKNRKNEGKIVSFQNPNYAPDTMIDKSWTQDNRNTNCLNLESSTSGINRDEDYSTFSFYKDIQKEKSPIQSNKKHKKNSSKKRLKSKEKATNRTDNTPLIQYNQYIPTKARGNKKPVINPNLIYQKYIKKG